MKQIGFILLSVVLMKTSAFAEAFGYSGYAKLALKMQAPHVDFSYVDSEYLVKVDLSMPSGEHDEKAFVRLGGDPDCEKHENSNNYVFEVRGGSFVTSASMITSEDSVEICKAMMEYKACSQNSVCTAN